jgi:hypothetical protein
VIRIRARLGDGHTSIEVHGHEEHAEQHPDIVSIEITEK